MRIGKIRLGKFFLLPLIVIISVLFLCILALVLGFKMTRTIDVSITTQKKAYQAADDLKLEIVNHLGAAICFSSCYPYYIEVKKDNWEISKYAGSYEKCSGPDTGVQCVDPSGVKAFEFNIPALESGTYRLFVPVCVGCTAAENFRWDKLFYSNEFTVK